MMKDIEAVLFDFDGTLVTLEIDFSLMRKRVNEIIAAFGVPSSILSAPFSWERIEQAAAWLAKFDPQRAKKLERTAKAVILDMEKDAAEVAVPPPDVLPTLLALKARGIKLALVTRNSMSAVRKVLERYPLPFDVIASRDHVRELKPNPAHLLFALQQMKVREASDSLRPCRHCAFVGDHPSDVQAALRAGLMPIGVALDDRSEQALKNAGAFVVVRKLSELARRLLG